VLVVEKQLVIHQKTHCQNTDIESIMEGGGEQIADSYRRIRARSEWASLRQRPEGRPIPRDERQQMVAKAELARAYLQEKCALGSKDGVKRKPSHFRQDWG